MRIVRIIPAILLIASFLVIACNDAEAPAAETQIGSLAARDSIQKLRKRIHADEKAQMLDTLFRNRVKRTAFNGCVLVAQEGEIIYQNAFGYADLKQRDTLTVNSAFQLASASKPFTAAAVLLLKDRGKISLNDEVSKYLPSFPYAGITIEMLLTHRSGLFNYLYSCEEFCMKPNSYNGGVFDNKAMLEIIADQKPAVYSPPGKKFEYCNTNYALLPLIVEKVSGLSFAAFMQQEIFVPLGMSNTWVHEPGKKREGMTVGHLASGKPEEECYADDVVGDKGIYSTVGDLLKWDRALYSDKLLKQATLKDAFTGRSNERRGKRNYGYGWRLITEGPAARIIYHNGWWHGYNSLFFRRPKDQATVIILSNKHNKSTYRIEDILGVLSTDSSAGEEMED
jgi:CubicO group peptidase (beta-lactamase class C family)